MTAAQIREAFLKYFESQGHQRVASSSLIPSNDPTLMFTAAGMVQFKDCFLGVDKRAYSRATTSQKCVRAGGKHNDLENVGFTSRHHTFFEMLGNFSFGDYFKQDAIRYAWEFSTKVLGLPKEKLRVSVHISDDESAKIWEALTGFSEANGKIVRFDEDNFWSAGDTGPCGPCTEIFYDQGEAVDGDRWLEYWNCVFMQYNRDASGKMTPLPKPSVDTGMGLERIASIMQGLANPDTSKSKWISNYEIDLMGGIVEATRALVKKRTGKDIDPLANKGHASKPTDEVAALRVITDHLRATSFLIADGVLPSNEGRGYVLRRILRRAVRFGNVLGLKEPFLAELFPVLQKLMGDTYPELKARASVITEILTQEETKFFETLERGLGVLDAEVFKNAALQKAKQIPSEIVFKLHDTFGFPSDLTALIAREKGFAIDEAGFTKLMEQAQERSRASWKGSGEMAMPAEVKEWKNKGVAPKFTGYASETESAKVLAVQPLATGEASWVAIDPCPFYAESGGQAGDSGALSLNGKTFEVLDTQKPYDGGIALLVKTNALKVGDLVTATVNHDDRSASKANHTATHLLHAALRKVLGTHVSQAGSLVEPNRLRFDFSHGKSVSKDEIALIEALVNAEIEKNTLLDVSECGYDDAIKKGAMALFSEKYGDKVRVVNVPGFSTELCGGTHVRSTGEIRVFKILSEGAVAAGTRRIEAVTATSAINYYRNLESQVLKMADMLKSTPAQVDERLARFIDNEKKLEKEILELKRKLVAGTGSASSLSGTYKGAALKVHVLEDADGGMLREMGDKLRRDEGGLLHVVISYPAVLVTCDPAKNPALHAGNYLKALSTALGGKGGGQAQTAQGSLGEAAKNPQAILDWSAGA